MSTSTASRAAQTDVFTRKYRIDVSFCDRQDLNPLDKAEAIVRELTEHTGLAAKNIPRILSNSLWRLNAQKRMKQVATLVTADAVETERVLD